MGWSDLHDVVIDAKSIAAAVLEEWKLWVETVQYGTPEESAKLSSAEKVAQWRPLPGVASLEIVIEEVFWASLLTEEARPCRPRLVYMTEPATADLSHHQFLSPIPLTRSHIRKLTAVQGHDACLEWRDDGGSPSLTGIYVPNALPLASSGRVLPGLALSSPASGVLNVDIVGERVFALRAGRVFRRSTCRLVPLDGALRGLSQIFGGFILNFFVRAVRAIMRHGHGGSLWMTQPEFPLDGLRIGYPLQLVDDFLSKPNRLEWMESVGDLTAVDGAVVVDAKGRLRGFGAFVDLGEPFSVATVAESGLPTHESSDRLGGGRHRSAAAFCRKMAPAAAVVVSQDGKVSVMGGQSSSAIGVWEVSPLGFGYLSNE